MSINMSRERYEQLKKELFDTLEEKLDRANISFASYDDGYKQGFENGKHLTESTYDEVIFKYCNRELEFERILKTAIKLLEDKKFSLNKQKEFNDGYLKGVKYALDLWEKCKRGEIDG